MNKKGFPESYDTPALLRFLGDVKAGKRKVRAPVYSHLVYDVVPGEATIVDRPDILILEGLNVLEPVRLPKDGSGVPFVSDFFDFSIYLDADEDDLRRWYVERFMRLRETAFRDPRSFFRRFAELTEEKARRDGATICGSASTCPICATTSCRPARAPISSCARAQCTKSRGGAEAA